MKRFLFVLIIGCLIATSCIQKSNINNNHNENVETASVDSLLITNELTYHYIHDIVQVDLIVDYPYCSNAILQNALCEYINETLGGSYDGSLEDGQQLVDFYGKIFKSELIKKHTEQSQELSEDNLNGFSKSVVIKKDYETDKLITFTVTEEIYLNGAHGMHYGYGQTFRKTDGRRFNTEMMCNLDTQGIHDIIKEGLRQYFSESYNEPINDESLKNCILTDKDIEYLPMPEYSPYITADGILFGYQPYEISFYAAGMPSFIVSFNDIMPYLTQTARLLIP